ncbi:lysozyme inhibitor LprI family protein [Rivularia sp. UHCC 0363]|uniref:lysozyme inhibitor LprI family protein n=1 Tax=Rivularia sp. UHCC 0363 TaxID=3110244 RepID=UPI002B2006D0|nr:lysozyme inhibitor LprI family protein [Rivularia sp. UHCC 0363]MEA5599286.1 lysozyme inhibitor LprI family protein [Rivularia sp. UHCC 0363]
MLGSQQLTDAQQFEQSQKAWLTYRDTHCKLAGSYVGSQMYSYCPMQLNILRVTELRELAGELDTK